MSKSNAKVFTTRLSLSPLLLVLFNPQVNAALPTCSNASFDIDGDGYGWENNASCLVAVLSNDGNSSNSQTGNSSGVRSCVDAGSDPDGDGYGWENNASCQITSSSGTTGSAGSSSQQPSCSSSASDPDGDGYGWENGGTCLVAQNSGTPQNDDDTQNSNSQNDSATCSSASSDPDGDGFGWENNTTCVVSSASTPANSGNNSNNNNGGESSGGESNSGESNTGGSNNGGSNNTGSINTGQSCNVDYASWSSFSTTSPGGLERRSSFVPARQIPSDTCLTRQDANNGNYHAPIKIGDFILATNAWNANAAGNFDWSQCIYANQNGAQAGWSYTWGAGGGSSDYNVRSYPELIYGVKSQGEISAPQSVTGLPVRIDRMPHFTIDYAVNSSESGPARSVDSSVNCRFPNGSTIKGERNIAVESFLHPADANGNCPASVVQRGSGYSNHTYEIMVWIDSGAERLPAAPADFVTNVNIDGEPYKVYTKASDKKYIAFVAQNPKSSGTLHWNSFIDWAQLHAHNVQSEFGARSNANRVSDQWCVANILVGTEIFWGNGSLDLLNWNISQY